MGRGKRKTQSPQKDLLGDWHREVMQRGSGFEVFVYYAALKKVTEALDKLISASMDDSGRPKAPERRVLMESRGCIPAGYSTSFPKKKREK